MEPLLSLVTGTLNRPAEMSRLAYSIGKHTTVSWELVVSDASDVDAAWFAGVYGDGHVRVHIERPRIGHVRGYNHAFAQTRGTYVIWLNDDAEVLPGYDVAAINFMQAHPEIGLGAFYYHEPPSPHFRVNQCMNMIFANFGILRREFGNQIGWFDEDLYMYGSDNSITFRTLLAGKGVAPIPGAFIEHHAVMDPIKVANQQYRKTDAPIMQRKYVPLKAQMQAEYRKHLSLVGPKVWIGGPNGYH